MSGRRALGLVLLLMLLFGLVAGYFTVSRTWRQSERLVAAGLRAPRGVALMPDDALVVAEAGTASAPGRLTWIAADSRGTLAGGMTGLVAVAAAPDERVLVLMGACDAPGCRSLEALDKSGRMTQLAELTGEPVGLAVGPDGTAYVSDAASGDVTRISPSIVPAGRVRLTSFGPGALPRGPAVGPDGALYCVLGGLGRLVRITPDGSVAVVADGLDAPVGVGFEPDGKMLVLERTRLIRIDPAKPTERTVVSANLSQPTSLLVAADGRAYVTAGTGDGGELLQIRRLGPQPAPRSI
jgi:streptogramin lyase